MTQSNGMLSELEDWYHSQCDGEWEHAFGVKIDTLDNPGWKVCVDLKETRLEKVSMEPVRIDNGENDWIFCGIKDTQFYGAGDPKKLQSIIQVFLCFTRHKV